MGDTENTLATAAFWIIQTSLILAKLFGFSDLSWFWVLSPLVFALGLSILLIVGAVVGWKVMSK